MQLKLYPFSYIQITLPYCLYIKRYKVKCLVFEKITLFWATLCGYNLYSRLKAVTLRQTTNNLSMADLNRVKTILAERGIMSK